MAENVGTHPLLEAHPAREALPNVASYIGVPVVLSDGTLYGTLCAVDPQPHRLTPQHTALLVVLARIVATQIERDRELMEREQAEGLLAGQSRILEMIARGTPLPDVLEAVTLLIEAYAPKTLCSIVLHDTETDRLHTVAAPHLPPAYSEEVDKLVIGPAVGSCGTAIFTRQTVIVTDIAQSPLWANYLHLTEPHGLRACWSTPIFSIQGIVLGAFAMYYREPREPGPYEFHLIDVATYLAGIAIERYQAEAERARLLAHLQETQADAERERDRLMTVLSLAPVGIVVWHSDPALNLMNDMMHHFARFPITPGTSLPDLFANAPITVETEDGVVVPIEDYPIIQAYRKENIVPTLLRLGYPNGETCECFISARQTPDGESVIVIAQDVTELRRAMRDALTAQAEIAALRQADAIKSKFIAVVSHELRTPLTGILGFAELLTLRELPSETVKSFGERILTSAERMKAMIDEYLNLQRLEAGVEEFHLSEVPVDAVVAEATGHVDRTQHPLVIDVPPLPPLWADHEKVRRVLENLVSNATKYSPVGVPIWISARVHGNAVEIRVRDGGIGIPLEAQPHIFEKFYRGKSTSPAHSLPGTGLGLAISREIVQRLEGTIGFESDESGTAFWVRLPFATTLSAMYAGEL